MESSIPCPSERKESRFKCQHLGCSKSYTRRDNLEAHVRGRHPSSGDQLVRFPCGIGNCDKVFKRADLCYRHRRTEHGTGHKRNVCGEAPEHHGRGCGRSFKRKDAMERHRRTKKARIICLKRRYPQAQPASPLPSTAEPSSREESPAVAYWEGNRTDEWDDGDSEPSARRSPLNTDANLHDLPSRKAFVHGDASVMRDLLPRMDLIHRSLYILFDGMPHPKMITQLKIVETAIAECQPAFAEAHKDALVRAEIDRELRTLLNELEGIEEAYTGIFNALRRCSHIFARLRGQATNDTDTGSNAGTEGDAQASELEPTRIERSLSTE